MTKVAICFLTYTPSLDSPRHAYAKRCLIALKELLHFESGEIQWHIADDGSPPGHVESLLSILGGNVTSSVTDHMGYGGNFNLATQYIHSEPEIKYVLPIEDDWEIVRHFDLSGLVRALDEDEKINCIRLGYLGWTDDLLGKLIWSARQVFLLLDPASPEKHVWTGHPRLERVSYEKTVGPWPEGVKAGYTELVVGGREEARKGVVWPMDAEINASQDYCRLFAHIGEIQA